MGLKASFKEQGFTSSMGWVLADMFLTLNVDDVKNMLGKIRGHRLEAIVGCVTDPRCMNDYIFKHFKLEGEGTEPGYTGLSETNSAKVALIVDCIENNDHRAFMIALLVDHSKDEMLDLWLNNPALKDRSFAKLTELYERRETDIAWVRKSWPNFYSILEKQMIEGSLDDKAERTPSKKM